MSPLNGVYRIAGFLPIISLELLHSPPLASFEDHERGRDPLIEGPQLPPGAGSGKADIAIRKGLMGGYCNT